MIQLIMTLFNGNTGNMTYEIIPINSENYNLVVDFIKNMGESKKTFRYFDNREISVLKNHVLTCVLNYKNRIIGYGHLDTENNKTWLGISIIDNFKGMGFGKILMNYLVINAKEKNLKQIYLTVDINNISAISLYKKFNFIH